VAAGTAMPVVRRKPGVFMVVLMAVMMVVVVMWMMVRHDRLLIS
jgi:hypothetical protein